MRIRFLIAIAASALLTVSFVGCRDEGPAEKAGKKIDEAASKAGDAIDDVKDKLSDD